MLFVNCLPSLLSGDHFVIAGGAIPEKNLPKSKYEKTLLSIRVAVKRKSSKN
ncbi:MAG: hypothetical protein AB1545_06105 [Thermodesulfobacteriota bacterium]